MKQLVAPWRMAFIKKARSGHECIFCKYQRKAQRKRARKNLLLYFGEHCFIMMNRYPYNNGHLMVAPYVHSGEISKFKPAVHEELMRLTGLSVKILKKALGCGGANCGINVGHVAGAGIAGHIHMHVVPRWLGDSNFFPVIADTKSMPEYLEETYDRLKPYFEKMVNPSPRRTPGSRAR